MLGTLRFAKLRRILAQSRRVGMHGPCAARQTQQTPETPTLAPPRTQAPDAI